MKFECVLKRKATASELSFELPSDAGLLERLKNVLSQAKKNNKDYLLVTVQTVRKPRTVGEGSQNHHLNGHIMQICLETGNDYDTIKAIVKKIAVDMGYPYREVAGHIVPIRERESSTEECAKLIEASHVLAGELRIVLREAE